MTQDKTPLAPGERKRAIIELLDALDIWLDGVDAISIQIDCKGKSIIIAPRPVINTTIK